MANPVLTAQVHVRVLSFTSLPGIQSPAMLSLALIERPWVDGARGGEEATWAEYIDWVVVSNIFYFHPYLGKIPILTNIFQMG